MNKKIIIFTIIIALTFAVSLGFWLGFSEMDNTFRVMIEPFYKHSSLLGNVPGGDWGYLYTTLTNGTHVIQSIILVNKDPLEIIKQEHYLLKINSDNYIIIRMYEKLSEIPSFDTYHNSGVKDG